MKSYGLVCLIVIISVLVLSAGCTSQQAATTPTPVATTKVVTTTAVPATTQAPVTTVTPANQTQGPRQFLVNKAWEVRSWRTEPEMDQKNASVQQFLADYQRRANDTFTWYDNGTLAYRYANGTAYTTGTWNLTKNNTAISEKFTSTDGFYSEGENDIVSLNATVFVIRYPVIVAGKGYYFIETQGV